MTLAVKSVLDLLFSRQQSWEVELARQWSSIVGNLHTRICLEKVDRDTIIVGVYDPHWMQELYLLSPMLIGSINKRLQGEYVHRVQFRLAVAQKKKKNGSKAVAPKYAPLTQKRALDESQQQALAAVKDPELQKELIRLYNYCQH